MNRPMYHDPAGLALVFAGGGLGTLARAGVASWLPASASASYTAVLIVNVAGALLIGLVAALAARGAGATMKTRGPLISRRAKQFLTTGFCGGLTTYSSFALVTASGIESGAVESAIGGAMVMLVAGVAAAAFGDWLGSLGESTGPRSRRISHDEPRAGEAR